MQAAKRYIVPTLLLIALVVPSLLGCGDSTRNDQGVSFTFMGWYQESSDGQGDGGPACEIGVTRAFVGISEGALDSESPGSLVGELESAYYVLLQNNLSEQFVRVERVVHNYYVPGASVQPPTTSVALPFVMSPVVGEDQTGFGSSLPSGFASGRELELAGNLLCAQIPMLPASVRSFISLNRAQFPETPFVIVVSSYATGVTSAGQSIESNPMEFEIVVTSDNPINASSGSSSALSSSSGSEEVAAEGGDATVESASDGTAEEAQADDGVSPEDFGDEL